MRKLAVPVLHGGFAEILVEKKEILRFKSSFLQARDSLKILW